MKVRLLTDRVGAYSQSQTEGDVIDVAPDEAGALIRSGQAEAVIGRAGSVAETAMVSPAAETAAAFRRNPTHKRNK